MSDSNNINVKIDQLTMKAIGYRNAAKNANSKIDAQNNLNSYKETMNKISILENQYGA